MSDELVVLLSELKKTEALEVVARRLERGDDPMRLLDDAREAMRIVGRRFSEGTYFIPELVYSGKILEAVAEIVKPRLTRGPTTAPIGRFVLGTVAGDLHDIGKNLVAFMMDVNGFEVHDLGVDVPPRAFVDKIAEVKPRIVGLSGFLTSVYQAMKDTVDAIAEAGLRDQVRIMIGGGVMDDEVRRYCGADAYGPDAMAAVSLARQWIEEPI
ncbi:MAG: cobalamin-dependent protein [Proteobacteria bacterium]|nr:cobalamin-dependent protein [Pseudomonadota bacterium]